MKTKNYSFRLPKCYQNSAKSAPKMRFRRVLRSLPVVSVFLNHPKSYTAFIAVFALVGHLYDKSLAIFLAILEIMPTFAQIM